MSRTSVTNESRESDGYIFSEFLLEHFHGQKKRDIFPQLSELTPAFEFTVKQREHIQSRLIKVGRPELWEKLKKRLRGYKSPNVELSVEDYLGVITKLKEVEKRVEKLETKLNL